MSENVNISEGNQELKVLNNLRRMTLRNIQTRLKSGSASLKRSGMTSAGRRSALPVSVKKHCASHRSRWRKIAF